VNRTFKSLKEEGLLASCAGGVELTDIPGLKEVACFDAQYLEENTEGTLNHVRETQRRRDS
jgi:hypothetical protein